MKKPTAFLLFLGMTTVALAQGDKLPISNLQVVPEGNGIPDITGTAVNEAGHELMVATIQFNLYDNSGAVVGNAVAQATNLGVGDQWKFKAQAVGPFAQARIAKVTVLPP